MHSLLSTFNSLFSHNSEDGSSAAPPASQAPTEKMAAESTPGEVAPSLDDGAEKSESIEVRL